MPLPACSIVDRSTFFSQMSKTIDDVIAELDSIIERTLADGSAAGDFPALYRRVTIAVKAAIARFAANLVRVPKLWTRLLLRLIRAFERGNVCSRIRIL